MSFECRPKRRIGRIEGKIADVDVHHLDTAPRKKRTELPYSRTGRREARASSDSGRTRSRRKHSFGDQNSQNKVFGWRRDLYGLGRAAKDRPGEGKRHAETTVQALPDCGTPKPSPSILAQRCADDKYALAGVLAFWGRHPLARRGLPPSHAEWASDNPRVPHVGFSGGTDRATATDERAALSRRPCRGTGPTTKEP